MPPFHSYNHARGSLQHEKNYRITNVTTVVVNNKQNIKKYIAKLNHF